MTNPARKPTPRGVNKHRDAEIKKIQIAKRWAVDNLGGFDDDTYRDLLQEAGSKKRSCTDLDWRGRMAVLKRFEELGWKPLPAKGARPAADRPSRRLADDDQSKMCRGIWIDLHTLGEVRDSSEKALNSFVKRMTKVSDLSWCNDNQKYVVIEALKDMRARHTLKLMYQWCLETNGVHLPDSLAGEIRLVLRGLRIGEHPKNSAIERLGSAGFYLLTNYKIWETQTYGTP